MAYLNIAEHRRVATARSPETNTSYSPVVRRLTDDDDRRHVKT